MMKICSCRIYFIEIFHIKREMEMSWRIRLLALLPVPGIPGEGLCLAVDNQMA